MKPLTSILITALSLALMSSTSTSVEKTKTFAVVELFTAEGCSSCPAADELLKEMTELLQKEGKEVFSLAFHVTYWNNLGWLDPYSQEAFTARQKAYVEKLKFQQLYTPQCVVNGQKEFIGSNPIGFRNEVGAALQANPVYGIEAEVKKEGEDLVINYELSSEPKNILMNIVIFENEVTHQVLRGENKNRTLKHYHVVKSLKTISPLHKGTTSAHWPEDLIPEKGGVILYIQHIKSMRITGATQLKLN
ncbi:hypothetical protein WSM22_21250 [Cytophagales bacterium WSM2-2]|nr:hypothetical protein WSM22_21250 [Cytophagales bacterium WSM2-2]